MTIKVESRLKRDNKRPIKLSKKLNERIWGFIEKNISFRRFLLNSLYKIEEHTTITGQHISDAKITVWIYSMNQCDDQMVCESIDIVFYTAEGVHKGYTFHDRINLFDFDLPADLAKNGIILIDKISKVDRNILINTVFIYSIVLLGLFIFYFVLPNFDKESVIVLAVRNGIPIILIGAIMSLSHKLWRAFGSGNKPYNVLISKISKDWMLPTAQNIKESGNSNA